MLPHVVHVPLAVADDPCRHSPMLQVGWSLHWYPLLVPEHEPVRYCDGPQAVLLHFVHLGNIGFFELSRR